jgi:hypothetical protein
VIYSDSRYSDATIFKAYDARRASYQITAFRNFPQNSVGFRYYVWVEGDRMDIVANSLLGNANLWSSIMDYNPEIIDAFDIPVGTVLRIPSVG